MGVRMAFVRLLMRWHMPRTRRKATPSSHLTKYVQESNHDTP